MAAKESAATYIAHFTILQSVTHKHSRHTMMAIKTAVVALFAFHNVSAGIFGRPAVVSRWGGSSSLSKHPWTEIRGGSTTTEEEQQQPEVSVDASELYLPGLLTASVVRTNSVRCHVSIYLFCRS